MRMSIFLTNDFCAATSSGLSNNTSSACSACSTTAGKDFSSEDMLEGDVEDIGGFQVKLAVTENSRFP